MTETTAGGLLVEGLSKSYPGVVALDAVDLRVPAGTIHGLVGENGAGKSTLLKCVAGAITPDGGTVSVDGTAITADLHAAELAGVAMIYQELTIVPELTALENVFLGAMPTRFGVVDRKAARARYRELAERIGASVRPGTRARLLSTSVQQQLEIMRALAGERRVLILDEPTASLGPADIARLHEVIRRLRDDGLAVVYVSHDLDAVLDVCDDVTVMREGSVVNHRPADRWTSRELVTAMVGRVPLATAGAERHRHDPTPMFLVQDLRAPGVDVPQLRIDAGEVLGVAGLVGSGRTRFLRALAGADPVISGTLTRGDTRIAWPRTTGAARRQGVMLAPEDRKRQGLVLDRAAGWNVSLGRFGRVGVITRSRLKEQAGASARSVGFDTDRLTAAAGTFSGGNQQKLLLARLLINRTRCLLLDEPTRGIDVGAKAQIFETIRGLVDDGHAVVWSSSDLTEVAQHSDRILVIAGGRLVAELPKGSSVQDILEHAFATESEGTEAVA
ncbi:sugar ABC transporter ATP-binding protein [Leifsonia shinshuensis]|uniref:Sugar ABC transporter ATP-binding protein n=1 Tax=Leifsonia shinshuensis TaxID=150026 RepID=A0A7G6YA45_9MICO|nr:sugar ABC transporter ATP-binding protein [Leifsonia shinshuensis]QNE35360.1 sugar ABC transporter ATP-binding protein [Leifsonia shinshuensis]